MKKQSFLEFACQQLVHPERQIYKESALGNYIQRVNSSYITKEDFQIKNEDGFQLKGNIFGPAFPKKPLIYVIYLHTRGGCRLEGLFLKQVLMPRYGLVLFDFAGSGQSEGNHITLGIKESRDLELIIQELIIKKKVKKIILWGRSMGAVTAL